MMTTKKKSKNVVDYYRKVSTLLKRTISHIVIDYKNYLLRNQS